MPQHRYFILNKPYDMLSQFKGGEPGMRMLGDLQIDFPEGIHPVGRLDNHSEGLLILTTNKRVTSLLFQGEQPHQRTYLVQVYKEISDETIKHLRTGVTIRTRGNVDYITEPCEVQRVERPTDLAPGASELVSRIPSSWLLITLTEGKFRQVRKMLSAVRHRCHRLIRISIEELTLGSLKPGHVREIEEEDFFRLLKIENWQASTV
ncbi:MAG: pseudouridine synthase [Siphonobacter sp.]